MFQFNIDFIQIKQFKIFNQNIASAGFNFNFCPFSMSLKHNNTIKDSKKK